MKKTHVIIILAVLGVAGFFASKETKTKKIMTFVTAEVEKGDIRQLVTASGTINPMVTVEVGSQISGRIEELKVDFNDSVTAGQLIALIDAKKFEQRVLQERASLQMSQAQVLQQKATLKSDRASLATAKRALVRQLELRAKGNAAEAAYDTAQLAVEVAEGRIAIGLAQVANALAVVEQRKAGLRQAEIDLEFCYIRSPIDGVVIERNVDAGQTVAASFSAPVLFRIAQDLRQVRVEAAVDEADIGAVRAGEQVSFTVDAHTNEKFEGVVEQVRLSPLIQQNVVTYTVTILAQNRQTLLLPGMTANIEITTGERQGVLRVPNAALRFRPSVELAPEAANSQPQQQRNRGGGRPQSNNPEQIAKRLVDRMVTQIIVTDEQASQLLAKTLEAFEANQGNSNGRGRFDRRALYASFKGIISDEQIDTLTKAARQGGGGGGRGNSRNRSAPQVAFWVEDGNGLLKRRFARVGIQDDRFTEITGGQLAEGETIVIGVRRK